MEIDGRPSDTFALAMRANAPILIDSAVLENLPDMSEALKKLRGEVYTINGVSNDVAVALKFLDKGEAVTTTHFYVLLNPAADLTPVEAYRIPPVSSDETDDVKLIAEHTDGIASTSLVEATTEE